MNPSTSSTAIGSLKPASPSSVRSSRLRSPAPRSSEKTAAPSVDETIEPSSRPSSVEKPNSHEAASPVTTAVISVPGSANPIAGRSTGRISPQPAVSPPSNRISASAITPIVSARSKSSKWISPRPSEPISMPSPRNSTRPGSRTRPATSDAASAAASRAPTIRMRSPSGKREAFQPKPPGRRVVAPGLRGQPGSPDGRVPGADRCDDLRGGVLLDVVPRAREDGRAVIGEERLPAPPLGVSERDVRARLDEQRGAIAERRQARFDLGQEADAPQDLPREDVHRPARFRSRERCAVGVHHALRQPLALDATRDDPLDEEVAPQDQVTADRTAEQPREHLRAEILLGPGPRVSDHERREAVRTSRRNGEADRAAPVLHHHRDAAQLQPLDQPLEHTRVLRGREAVAGRRRP